MTHPTPQGISHNTQVEIMDNSFLDEVKSDLALFIDRQISCTHPLVILEVKITLKIRYVILNNINKISIQEFGQFLQNILALQLYIDKIYKIKAYKKKLQEITTLEILATYDHNIFSLKPEYFITKLNNIMGINKKNEEDIKVTLEKLYSSSKISSINSKRHKYGLRMGGTYIPLFEIANILVTKFEKYKSNPEGFKNERNDQDYPNFSTSFIEPKSNITKISNSLSLNEPAESYLPRKLKNALQKFRKYEEDLFQITFGLLFGSFCWSILKMALFSATGHIGFFTWLFLLPLPGLILDLDEFANRKDKNIFTFPVKSTLLAFFICPAALLGLAFAIKITPIFFIAAILSTTIYSLIMAARKAHLFNKGKEKKESRVDNEITQTIINAVTAVFTVAAIKVLLLNTATLLMNKLTMGIFGTLTVLGNIATRKINDYYYQVKDDTTLTIKQKFTGFFKQLWPFRKSDTNLISENISVNNLTQLKDQVNTLLEPSNLTDTQRKNYIEALMKQNRNQVLFEVNQIANNQINNQNLLANRIQKKIEKLNIQMEKEKQFFGRLFNLKE